MARSTRLSRRARAFQPEDFALPGYLAACLLLGGSSYVGFFANALLQLGGLAVLVWRGIDGGRCEQSSMGRLLGGLTLAYLAWTLLTLVPLPASLWVHAGGRDFLSASYAVLGLPVPARPLSLDPDRTVASALSIIPPLAVLALTLSASDRSRVAAIGAAMIVAIVSVPVGALQLLGGANSAWYFYSPTNIGNAVGFFANANHLATLFLMTLPLIAALAARARATSDRKPILGVAAFAGVFAFALFGLILAGSVAGWLLLVPAVCGSALVWRRGIGRPVPLRWVAGGAALLALLVLFAVLGPLRGLLLNEALAGETDPVTREVSMTLTAHAIRDFLPFGSGLGSFRWLYTRYEDASAVTGEFNVHTHNDWLEFALEQGLAGIAILATFLVWYARRAATLWRGATQKGSIARAATVSLGLLLLHSLVDFPVRTAAIAALAGFCVAVLHAPQPRASRRDEEEEDTALLAAPAPVAPGRHLSV